MTYLERLKETVRSLHALVEACTEDCRQLRACRQKISDSVTVELDQRIEVGELKIAALHRSIKLRELEIQQAEHRRPGIVS